MSYPNFPVLPGLDWSVVKKPIFRTKIQYATSGKETSLIFWPSPRWQFSLKYNVLRDLPAYEEFQSLIGFFMQAQGSGNSWNYVDPYDNTATAQVLGTGDGVAHTFQLSRAMGGFAEPIKFISGAPLVYLNGALQTSGYSISTTGLITFVTAPGTGIVVTATFTFYFKCRFGTWSSGTGDTVDEMSFENFMHNLWEAKQVEFISKF